jgi:hypothetical protein
MTIKVTFSSIYLSSRTLFETFAGAQVQNRGGEEDDCCDSKNGVVHEEKNRLRMLRKWSAGDKDFVSREDGEVRKQRGNEVTIKRGIAVIPLEAGRLGMRGDPSLCLA